MSNETKGRWSGKGMLDIAQQWAARDGRTDAVDLSAEDTKKFGDPMLTMAAFVLNQMSDETSHPTYLRVACRMQGGRVLTVAVDIKPEGAERQDAINARMKDQRDDLLVAARAARTWFNEMGYGNDDGIVGPLAAAIAKAEDKP